MAKPERNRLLAVELTGMSLAGMEDGNALSLGLNPSFTSSGTTSITADGANFNVSSFFDVFAEVTCVTPGGTLTATPSGRATATAAPEPATLALLAGPFVVLPVLRHRRG